MSICSDDVLYTNCIIVYKGFGILFKKKKYKKKRSILFSEEKKENIKIFPNRMIMFYLYYKIRSEYKIHAFKKNVNEI